MSGDEPRRSVRANKGQHNKNASPSPGPTPKATKATKGKGNKKQAAEPEVEEEPEEEEEEEEDEVIRCICGNDNRNDKRPFIACDACSVWQHNICMGIPDDEDDVPEHYFCEDCRPQEHAETLQALARGEKIWESRNKIYQAERKAKGRKKAKQSSEDVKPGWLKKDVPPLPAAEKVVETTEKEEVEETTTAPSAAATAPEAPEVVGTKRKREEIKEEDAPETKSDAEDKPTRPGRHDKRRKSSAAESKTVADPETALVKIDQLPADRKKVAVALSKIVADDVQGRVEKSEYQVPEGQNAESIGDHYGARIEYALKMNHGGVKEAAYGSQFRALIANLKKNRSLIQRLLSSTLTSDELATMSTSDMASEELQRERAELKEVLDRQAVAITEEGPRYRQDHKGYHAIESDGKDTAEKRAPSPPPAPASPVLSGAKKSESQEPSTTVDGATETAGAADAEEEASAQQFDINDIWAKTAQSPTTATPQGGGARKPSAARRSASIQIAAATPQNGAKDDPDVDRMLQDNPDDEEEDYTPAAATGSDAVVWRGKVIQTSEEDAPVLNARFVAGRDLVSTISWQDLLPPALSIDGRLQIQKAEDYLCGLRWSSSSDVSVLSLTPYDNAAAFNKIFEYFATRQRYAVVEKGKPNLVKELYIIPVEVGANLPEHIEMLEYCSIKKPVEERLLLASLTVARAPDNKTPPAAAGAQDGALAQQHQQQTQNAGLPQHLRQSISGPAGSPLTSQTPFSPSQHNVPPPASPYGATATASPAAYAAAAAPHHPFPPNPYGAQVQPNPLYAQQQQQPTALSPPPNPRVTEILGDLQYTNSARQILQASPHLSDQQLQGLRNVLAENPESRENLAVLTAILQG